MTPLDGAAVTDPSPERTLSAASADVVAREGGIVAQPPGRSTLCGPDRLALHGRWPNESAEPSCDGLFAALEDLADVVLDP